MTTIPQIPPANGLSCMDCPGSLAAYYEGQLVAECPEAPYNPDAADPADLGHENVDPVYITRVPLGRPDDADNKMPGQDLWIYSASFEEPTP